MIGQNPSQPALFQMVDLESLVPKNHRLRQIDAALDLSFVREAVVGCHVPSRGRPLIDPELAVRMMLLGVLYDLSERQLCDEIRMHAGFRWFCRLNFHDPVPDTSDVDAEEAVSLDFSARLVSPGPEPHLDLAATGGVGQIHAQGTIGTSIPCYDIDGQVTRDGRDLTLRVVATGKDVVCVQVAAAFAYEATLDGLEPGTYRLRIGHTGAPERTSTVWEQEVRVQQACADWQTAPETSP